MGKGIEVTLELPEKVEARKDGTILILKGSKGENKRNIANPIVNLEIGDRNIIISTKTERMNEM